MEKFDHKDYRNKLAEDLKAIPDHIERKEELEEYKEGLQGERYEVAKELHQEDIEKHLDYKERVKKAKETIERREKLDKEIENYVSSLGFKVNKTFGSIGDKGVYFNYKGQEGHLFDAKRYIKDLIKNDKGLEVVPTEMAIEEIKQSKLGAKKQEGLKKEAEKVESEIKWELIDFNKFVEAGIFEKELLKVKENKGNGNEVTSPKDKELYVFKHDEYHKDRDLREKIEKDKESLSKILDLPWMKEKETEINSLKLAYKPSGEIGAICIGGNFGEFLGDDKSNRWGELIIKPDGKKMLLTGVNTGKFYPVVAPSGRVVATFDGNFQGRGLFDEDVFLGSSDLSTSTGNKKFSKKIAEEDNYIWEQGVSRGNKITKYFRGTEVEDVFVSKRRYDKEKGVLVYNMVNNYIVYKNDISEDIIEATFVRNLLTKDLMPKVWESIEI